MSNLPPIDLDRENGRLAAIVARLSLENGQMKNLLFAQARRQDEDDLRVGRSSARRHMWAVFGPTNVLPGSVFHLRRNAIDFAEETMGMKWAKCRRMGYICDKVRVVPTTLES